MISSQDYFNNPQLIIDNLTGEFEASDDFDSSFIEHLCYDGFLPMADTNPYDESKDVLIIKFHNERCIISPSSVKIGKTIKRNAHEFSLTINHCFDTVMQEVWEQHGNYWFSKELYQAIKPLINKNDLKASFHSIELWKNEKLVAGDIGMVSGSRYLSMTGFYKVNGSGSVLLASIGKLLNNLNFDIWDLGMELPYKISMGAQLITRNDFIKQINIIKDKKLNFEYDKISCLTLLNN
ncbi:MAG: hypothetical protein A2015_02430 [Spirochaetes bacterium GWF1_31_7]|nr:MAG: hypothetical protein A2Y30_06275 [Spirochaetes bacterium GWE1_32_154]OHD50713.1 MAG: hypothetical protein A2Y29_09200 [Spirochaetes bacterium GWE2_31_10]OHD50769.1 MAG: hypothetical protein A2015_02430 [Spirochaetes bacterium GWF1_31_7]OHD73661.1 MAG: hypothetical protein A2355_11420 [Spirochaetes bacterium RIFOXYB1_FULL_32_8]HBD95108.1 hypothetical protein [Spirochaetia bacterium]